jgi:hypothetical protein
MSAWEKCPDFIELFLNLINSFLSYDNQSNDYILLKLIPQKSSTLINPEIMLKSDIQYEIKQNTIYIDKFYIFIQGWEYGIFCTSIEYIIDKYDQTIVDKRNTQFKENKIVFVEDIIFCDKIFYNNDLYDILGLSVSSNNFVLSIASTIKKNTTTRNNKKY